MINVKEYLEAIDFKISGGSEFNWDCYGPYARYLDCNHSEYENGNYSINAIFDSSNQVIYAIEAWDYINNREYRWIDPDFRNDYDAEARDRGIDPAESLDGKKFIDLEVAEDILEKIAALVRGEEYDTRVKVPIDFTDEELLEYMKLAHDMDITFNELVERAIKNAIDEYQTNPDGFKQRAERFLNED